MGWLTPGGSVKARPAPFFLTRRWKQLTGINALCAPPRCPKLSHLPFQLVMKRKGWSISCQCAEQLESACHRTGREVTSPGRNPAVKLSAFSQLSAATYCFLTLNSLQHQFYHSAWVLLFQNTVFLARKTVVKLAHQHEYVKEPNNKQRDKR